MEFKEKVSIITGGSKGIGLSCAEKLASEGSKIFLLSSNLKNLQEASLRIKKSFDVEVGFEAVDLRLLESCKKGVESALNKFGRCDILVHSAGATKGGIFPFQPDEDMIDGFALKFHAAVRIARILWSELKKSKGVVINISGGYARDPSADHMVGGAVNSALSNFSKALAEQGLRDDINVNWINPGMIKTQRLEHSFHTRSIQQKKSIIQLKSETMTLKGIRRLGEPEDVASLVLFLCKKEARHIQGCGINIDGGENKSYF